MGDPLKPVKHTCYKCSKPNAPVELVADPGVLEFTCPSCGKRYTALETLSGQHQLSVL